MQRLYVCEVAAEISNAFLEQAGEYLETDERKALEHIVHMPKYCAEHRLDDFDEEFKEKTFDLDKPWGRLIEEVMNLACYNLYGAFQAVKTTEYFDEVKAKLKASGIIYEREGCIVNWSEDKEKRDKELGF